MTRTSELSLTRLSLSSITWYLSVVAGWALLGVAVVSIVTTPRVDQAAALAMTAVLLVVLELLPLVQGRGHDPQGVVMSTAFAVAMLVIWGAWPALVMVALASLASDLRARKSWSKVAFNPAQYALSVGSSYLVMLAFGSAPTLAHPLTRFQLGDMVWVVLVWLTYFVVNLVLVGGVLSFTGSFRSAATDDFLHVTTMTFAVLAISPLIVLVAQSTWSLLPLLLVPLLLLYYTAQMSLQREHAASHDGLTGLPNRANLQFELSEAITRYRIDQCPFGLILIDLDDFKRVNDTLGHTVGDDLLRQFARRLEQSIRPGDRVARLGGDEFAVILSGADRADSLAVADRIHGSIADSIELSGIALQVELSLGIATCPQHGTDPDTLLQRADVAMYVAKKNRSAIEVYSTDRDENSTDRLGLLGELRQALDDDVLELHYQPKVSTADRSLLGMEALVRWRHPVRGYIPPDQFIPLAERSGIMPLLTERVIALALAQMARWRSAGVDVPVAVNIAPTDLLGEWLADVVERGLREWELPAAMLRLEITERIVTHGQDDTKAALTRLRAMGVTVSLDDFGTGYSSLMRLRSLPVDELKIDRAFVCALADGGHALGVLQALIDLAHALGVPAIAEGVETAEEYRVLHSMGCDGVQGWHVAMPMSTGDATQWVLDRSRVISFRRGVVPEPLRAAPSSAAFHTPATEAAVDADTATAS